MLAFIIKKIKEFFYFISQGIVSIAGLKFFITKLFLIYMIKTDC